MPFLFIFEVKRPSGEMAHSCKSKIQELFKRSAPLSLSHLFPKWDTTPLYLSDLIYVQEAVVKKKKV